MRSVGFKSCVLGGETGKLLRGITSNWLLGIRESNPAILDMFRDRDRKPYRELLPWSGEFAGKYLTGAAYVYRLTKDAALYDYVTGFIEELMTLQAEDGYLGCYARDCRLTGAFSQDPSQTGGTWDAWAHYHAMYGLLLWYDLTGNDAYFQTVKKAAALFLRTFYEGKKTVLSICWQEMNLSVYHLFALLYRRTGKEAYRRFALCVEKDIETEGAGEYLRYALTGYPYYQCPKPRWESLHAIMGYAEMYRTTGEARYLEALTQIFFSILETDVHNTGAFSTDEQAVGHPFGNGNIETCCVVAYNALAIEVYALTGDNRILDHLERAHYNAVLGYYSPTGRWSTYHTPMEGTKCANFHSIGFQCRPGSPELNCCSVNAPRGVAAVSDWLLTRNDHGYFLNFYEDVELETEEGFRLTVSGGYPAAASVRVAFSGLQPGQRLSLRIPTWSAHTVISCGGENCCPLPGTFWPVPEGVGELTIQFDFTPYSTAGDREYAGRHSLYVGPVLYGFDTADNTVEWGQFSPLPHDEWMAAVPAAQPDGSLRLNLPCGVTLRDFYHLGVSGSFYSTWLPLDTK